MIDDRELLRQYAKAGSEKAFNELVSRHLPLVYSAALRQLEGDHELAKDVAQNVFIDLARKAGSLAGHEVLTGWLYTSTRFAAVTIRRSQHRRKAREELAAAMQAIDIGESSSSEWESVSPVLDESMHELSPDDRVAVLLRFFEGKNFNEIGRALDLSEDAARMRVTRALGKLHSILAARGVNMSGAALTALLATSAVHAAPAGLAIAIAGACLSVVGTGGGIVQVLLHAAPAKWQILAISGMAIVAVLTLGIYSNTRSSEPATEQLAQVNSSTDITNGTTPVSDAVSSPAAAPMDYSVRAENQMQFQLLDAETGAPIPAAKLRVNYFGVGGQMNGVKVATDGRGRVAIEFPKQPYTGANLFVTAEGHVPKVVSWNSAELPKEYTMKLETGSTISGVVVDEYHQAVPQATITFGGPGIDMSKKENIQFGPDTVQSTDAYGRWSCNLIPKDHEAIQVMLTHPEFAPTPVRIPVNAVPAANLVWQLQRGITVTGLVVDAAGQVIAGAALRQIHNRMGPVLSSTTDTSGKFEMKHLPAGDLLLAVQAKGLAPEVLETNLSASPTELSFVLQPGQVLRGRVVDEQGMPITNAVAKTDWDNQGLRKIEWSAKTDHEGRFEWDSAPTEALLYWFEAEGFSWSRGKLLKADGAIHEIKLTRKGSPTAPAAVQITGGVRDEETGLPIEEFNVLIGEIRSLTAEPEFRFIADGRGGRFSIALRPPHLFGVFQVQLEKEGYLPVVSTNLSVTGGNQTLDFKMRKGSGPSGIVVLPSGEPARHATVFLYEARGSVYMDKPGTFRKDVSSVTHVQTDEAGRFSFAPKLQARGLMVIEDQGYAELPLNVFNGNIVLQPWGRVEGKLTIGGAPAANETISLANVLYRYGEHGRQFPALSLWLEAKTDADGNFTFDKVPPGERKICRRLGRPEGQLGRNYETHGFPVTISAGAVTRIELGGTGRAIVGKLGFLADPQSTDWRSVAIDLRLLVSGAPGSPPNRGDYATTEAFIQDLKAFSEAARRFWMSEEGREVERSQRRYSAFCGDDGSFLLPDIPPGKYELKIEKPPTTTKNAVGPSQLPMVGTAVSLLVKEVMVPEVTAGHENDPLDLGVLDFSASSGAK